jgi:hypothetical protein
MQAALAAAQLAEASNDLQNQVKSLARRRHDTLMAGSVGSSCLVCE